MRPDQFQDTFRRREGVYQFTMEHLEKARLFRSESDYDYGVNSIALGTCEHPKVRVLCYSLMDNHLHLLLKGRYEDCLKYYLWLVRRLRIMLKQRYNVTGLLKDMAFDISAVTDDRMFQNEVAYIIRNTYKARMFSPFSFPWNSADTYFNPLREAVHGTRIETMQITEVKALFQTHTKVPGNWTERLCSYLPKPLPEGLAPQKPRLAAYWASRRIFWISCCKGRLPREAATGPSRRRRSWSWGRWGRWGSR